MRLREWPNKLGWDYRDYEIFKHSEGFRITGDHRAMFVPFELATNPHDALLLCQKYGCKVSDLQDMDYLQASAEFLNQWRRIPCESLNFPASASASFAT